MTMTNTTMMMLGSNAIILIHYYEHMRCTRSKHIEIPRCEPLHPLDDLVQTLFQISCFFGKRICSQYSQRTYIYGNSV